MTGQELHDRVQAVLDEYKASQNTGIVVKPGDNLQSLLEQAPENAHFVLAGNFVGNFVFPKPVLIQGGSLTTPNTAPVARVTGGLAEFEAVSFLAEGLNTNDIVVLTAAARFDRCEVVGNGSTKRGISAQGKMLLMRDSNVLNICRVGQDSQAVATWDGDDITLENCVLEAASQSFMSGGASPTVPNHVPSNITLSHCTLTRKLEWRGMGLGVKNAWEIKSGRHIHLLNCQIENVWKDAQVGFAGVLTPSQYGNSPECVVEDVLVEGCTHVNVAGGYNILGRTQHDEPELSTQRTNTLRFIRNTFVLSMAWAGGGTGGMIQIGRSPIGITCEENDVEADGGAWLRVTDRLPVEEFSFQRNKVTPCGTYGVFAPQGSRGVAWAQIAPAGVVRANTFKTAHATFKANFPENTYV